MKIMLLASEAPKDFALRDDKEKSGPYMDAWSAFGRALREAGVHVASEALRGPETATVVSLRDGARRVEDGPFPDAKEQLGGFVIIDVEDLNVAAAWAAKCPAARNGYVDVRPVPYLETGVEK